MNNNIDNSFNSNEFRLKLSCSPLNNNGHAFIVEKIIGKRIRNGNTYYMVKWGNYKDQETTWEPIQNLTTVKEFVNEYEKEVKEKSSISIIDKSTNNISTDNIYGNIIRDIPDKIIGVNMKDHHLSFIISWEPRKNSNKEIPLDSVVSNYELKKHFPVLLLDFYEAKLIYNNTPIQLTKFNK